MGKIPTAEDFIKTSREFNDMWNDSRGSGSGYENNIKNGLITFAKLHVQAALEAACDKLVDQRGPGHGMIVLDSYPETNIV